MKKRFIPWLVAWCVLFTAGWAAADDTLKPSYLRAEYRIDPLGIDEQQPRLSWIVESSARGQRQTAYRVLVASSPERLAENEGDLWDSGPVECDETTAIVYAGEPLSSRARCYWKVMVWDKDGRSSGWSEPALWMMGLLNADDWQAKWIGYERPLKEMQQEQPDDALAGAFWIWFPEGEPAKAAPAETRYFRKTITLPADREVESVQCAFAADNRFELFVNGERAGQGTGFEAAQSVEIARLLTPGENVIAVAATNLGDAPNPAGLLGVIHVEFREGEPLTVVTDESWTTNREAADDWTEAEFDDGDWQPAKQLAANGGGPWAKVTMPSLHLPPARYLRTSFALDKPVRRATVYSSALGIYELSLNGRRVGDEYFAPGWTDYDRRVYYQTYDVTDQVQQGENALGAVVADGWYAGYLGFGGGRDFYGQHIRVLAQLEIEFEDGSKTIVASGPQWKASTGPLTEADFLMGETHDARREMPGWDAPGFDDSEWQPVDVTERIEAALQVQPHQPVVELLPISPVEVSEPQPGKVVVDMGQNFAGVVRIRVRGEPGQKIQLRHAERLNPDGSIYTENLRSARALDTYICRGDEPDDHWWQPRFTFHGFQYVEVNGYPDFSREDIQGIAFSSDTPVVGSFECSDPMVNQLFSNIYWTQRMNFIDIPTDCPQRDERLGWTGDAQVYIRAASMIADVQAFFTKWLVDLEDAQREDGQYPMIAPLKSKGPTADGGPAWADAGVICPWNLYEVYGDTRVLERHYDGMQRFIEFTKNRSTPELLPPEEFHAFGDWLNIDDDTPKDVIYQAYFAHSTQLMSRIAEALGKTDDEQMYRDLFERIKSSFNEAFVAADGRVKGDSQTAYVLALAFDLVEGQRREQAAEHLIRRIEERDGHLSTGFIGTKDLMLVLSKIGRDDIAYRLLHNTTFPSWGFSIKHRATTIWERWNGWTPEEGFADPGMNSFAHYSFGAVAQWMFETIGGIRTAGPAFKRIMIRPVPGGQIDWARTSYRSIRGLIATDWKIDDGTFMLNVTIPANTTAEVHIPTRDRRSVTEGGRPAEASPGVTFLRTENGAAVYRVGSGEYSFVARAP